MRSYLVAAYGVTPLPKLWAERLSAVMKPDQPAHIVDLGSGSGGPIPHIGKELRESGFMVRVTLTDLFPHPNTPRFAQDEQPHHLLAGTGGCRQSSAQSTRHPHDVWVISPSLSPEGARSFARRVGAPANDLHLRRHIPGSCCHCVDVARPPAGSSTHPMVRPVS